MASIVLQKLKNAQKKGKEGNQTLQRSIGRNISELEREEKALENDIRRAASQGNRAACISLAQELTKIRALKTRNSRFADQMNIVQRRQTALVHAAKCGESMELASETMKNFNKAMDKTNVSEQLRKFEKEELQLDMSEDTLDSMLSSLCESDDIDADDYVMSFLSEPQSDIFTAWPSVSDTPLVKSTTSSKMFHDNIV
ncbi:unnamed protein product [Schistosoma turkestanicum]|nr:unnamed protein product [Schistosoma turkestanicum]